jgi:hypothetical protein
MLMYNGVKKMFVLRGVCRHSNLSGGEVSIRLTDVAIGRRHMQYIVPVIVPSFTHRVCAETVDEGVDVV